MTPLDAMLDERARANREAVFRLRIRHALWPAVAAGVVVAVALALLVHIVVGLIAGLVVGGAVGWWRWTAIDAAAVPTLLELIGARPATESEFPRYLNLIEGLSMSSGIPAPGLYVLDDPAANAAAFGAGSSAALVATTGLLHGVTRVELEGVLAEELARIRVGDAELAGYGALLVCGPLLHQPGQSPPPPTKVSRLDRLATLLDAQRHFLADMSAGSLTRYPPGLRGAFVRMSGIGTTVSGVTWGAAHLWMCDPLPVAEGGGGAGGSARTDHPPIQHRIDLLAEL